MQETIITCDSCGKKLKEEIRRFDYDLCERCVESLIKNILKTITLRIDCEGCKREGKLRVRDDEASDAQASCGENRTVYKTIECDKCFHG